MLISFFGFLSSRVFMSASACALQKNGLIFRVTGSPYLKFCHWGIFEWSFIRFFRDMVDFALGWLWIIRSIGSIRKLFLCLQTLHSQTLVLPNYG